MTKGLQTSALGMVPKMLKMDVIANNLANINSKGFKKSDVFVRELIQADVAIRDNNSKPLETSLNQSQKIDLSQGELEETKNPLDVAISGDGFFVIDTPKGLKYTRNGNFSLGADGSLVTAQGYHVLGEKGPIYFPNPSKMKETQINISKKGEITVGQEKVANLQIVNFSDNGSNHGLNYAGENLLSGSENLMTPLKYNDFNVHQGFLENSNVNALQEMVKMIELNTSFQADQKAIRYQDSSLQTSNDIGKI